MRLLIVTQTVDSTDLYLGFFVRWIEELATSVERIEVICLFEGAHSLPENVTVHSLGKEKGRRSSISYAWTFSTLVWKLAKKYDSVFVHMNQEYVLLAGLWWRMMGKRVYLWRNHYAGSWMTALAASMCHKVFYTSDHSYTARFRNAVSMPVGVDSDRFSTSSESERHSNSILFFGRFTESKKPHVFVKALEILSKETLPFSASIYGSALSKDLGYREGVMAQAAGLRADIRFYEGVPNDQAPGVFGSHSIYVNLGQSGMFDKTIFEAAASGCLVLARSNDWRELVQDDRIWSESGSPEELAQRLAALLSLSTTEKAELLEKQNGVVRAHSLRTLADRLMQEMG